MRWSLMVLVGCVACGAPSANDGGEPLPPADSGSMPVDAGEHDGGLTVDAGEQMDAGAACGAGVMPADGVAFTTTGAVQGTTSGDVTAWLGIPYAAPPVGALRFRAPQPHACWNELKPTQQYGAICPQQSADGGVLGSEDCLSVNVWSKRGSNAAPVLVFVHGGGNLQGASSYPYYDGSDLAARQGAVVVTLNYRLGALGFFAHAGLNAESDAGVSGNYGILDQQAALRWVRDNAEAFGGDPAKVLLFGESAGAQNTLLHLVAPGSAGLFRAALVESGGFYRDTLSDALTDLQPVVAAVGCGSASDAVACLRGASMESFVRIPSAEGPLAKGMRYGPVVDGVVIPGQGLDLINQGKHHHVPFVIGTNADETSRMVPPVMNAADYEAAVRAQYGAVIGNKLLMQYPASRFTTPRQALVALTTDTTWTCSARRIARAVASHQSEPVYRYFFTWKSSGVAGAVVGSTHGLELPFIFRTFSAFGGITPDANATALSDAMQQSWVGLAENGVMAAPWPRFPVSGSGDAALELGAMVQPLASVRASDCDFIDSLTP